MSLVTVHGLYPTQAEEPALSAAMVPCFPCHSAVGCQYAQEHSTTHSLGPPDPANSPWRAEKIENPT